MIADSYEILGLMSGSSLDGLDLAWCSFRRDGKHSGFSFEIVAFHCYPFSEKLKSSLAGIRQASALGLAETDHEFVAFSAQAVLDFCRKMGRKPLAIASHGHTAFHNPGAGYTVQIGNGGLLSGLTGLSVVCDFRTLDVALGGQGAPLVPAAEAELFSAWQACLNLGGICNISFPGSGTSGFDLAPCNQLLNFLSKQKGLEFDKDGHLAAAGKLLPELMEMLDGHPYYSISAPKSLANEEVETQWLPMLLPFSSQVEDALFTICRHLGKKIGSSLPIPSSSSRNRLLISGGGAFHPLLMTSIREHLPESWEAETASPDMIQAKEALCFGWLGLKRLLEEENVLASVTGARENSVSGALYGINPLSGMAGR